MWCRYWIALLGLAASTAAAEPATTMVLAVEGSEVVLAAGRLDGLGAGARVTLLHRGPSPTCRAEFVAALEAEPRVTSLSGRSVTRFVGSEELEAVVHEGADGEQTLAVQAALVRVGWEPNSDAVPRGWLDHEGFVRVDNHARLLDAGRAGAAGDITGPASSSVASAAGAGANAARALIARLERDLSSMR